MASDGASMFRRGRSWSLLRRAARVALTVAVLCGVLAGAVGFPVTPGLLGGEFPCQGHGCGCRSAAECWLGCCCLTPGQRLAWAKRRGVTPPAELVALAEAEPSAKACSGHGSACCRHKAATAKTCCGGKAAARDDGGRGKEEAPGAGFTTVHCRGFVQWWAAAGQPLALPERGVAISGGMTSVPVAVASIEYAFLPSPPPTRPG